MGGEEGVGEGGESRGGMRQWEGDKTRLNG